MRQFTAAIVVGGLLLGGVSARSGAQEAVDPANSEISFTVNQGLLDGPKPNEKVLMAFSRRDGKSFPGVVWLVPPIEGRFPQIVNVDFSTVNVSDDAVNGAFTMAAQGIATHTCVIDGEIENGLLTGTVTVSAAGKTAVRPIADGRVFPPTPSHDPPLTDPAMVPIDKPWGETIPVAHPFMLWTKAEAAALRKRIETDEDARKQSELTLARMAGTSFANLYKYMILGDQAAGNAEKGILLGFIGSHPSNFYTGIGGGRHFDNYEAALRYDILYDLLTPEQRTAIEKTFRGFVKHHVFEDYKREYTRTNWLPNMQWPRAMGAHLMAVALRDREIIRRTFESIGGWKWYLDDYIADGYFYMEEFGKQYSMGGEMILWCWALDRLGLPEWGFDYVGKAHPLNGFGEGATMRRYVEGLYRLGLPREAREGRMPRYPHPHMGDAGASALVDMGENRFGKYWTDANMNGRDYRQGLVPRLATPLWFEACQARYPKGGFDYALAQMREFGSDTYYPTLLFGLSPIEADAVQPWPARSYAARERGFAMLRAQEGPAYWTSPAPAVALQFGMYYVHYVHDCFTLLEYYAFNRKVYTKRAFGPHRGYAGGHPWRDTVRGHNGVVVDHAQIQFVDDGDSGCAHQAIRDMFAPDVKFTAVRAKPMEQKGVMKALYEGVDMERALFLTDAYLFDAFRCVSDRPRLYHWNAHPLGVPVDLDAKAWPATDEFNGGKLWSGAAGMAGSTRSGGFDLPNVRKRVVGDDAWTFQTRQSSGVGVRVQMLSAPDTTLFHDNAGEITTLLVQRQTPKTVFAALHEHYKETPIGLALARIAETDAGLAVRISGGAIDDRILLAYDDAAGAPLELAGAGESFTFVGQAYVCATPDELRVTGDLRAMRVKVDGKPALTVNSKRVPADIKDGYLEYTAP